MIRNAKPCLCGGIMSACILVTASAQNVQLRPADSRDGYLACLLINEAPFPGERGYRSEADSEASMLAILWVLHCRLHYIPTGYTQEEVAAVQTRDVIDVMTAGGIKGQVDGFYRDAAGRFRTVARVEERIRHLTALGNQGKPGRIARLLNHAQYLASAYLHSGPAGPDLFAAIRQIQSIRVTGRSFSWMTDGRGFTPGGNFVTIPNQMRGSLGGNRFFTLRMVKR